MALSDLRAMLSDRQSLVFLVVLPLTVIVLLATVVRAESSRLRVGVVAPHSPLATHLVRSLEGSPTLRVSSFPSVRRLDIAVRRGEVEAGAAVAEDYDTRLLAGQPGAVMFVSLASNRSTAAVRNAVDAVATREASAAQAARVAAKATGQTLDEELRVTRRLQADQRVAVDRASSAVPPIGGVQYTAPALLVLFMFVNSLGAAGAVAWARHAGLLRRVLGTPTSAATAMAGLGAGRFAIALAQAAIILVFGVVLGVHWGDPLAVALLVTMFALVSTGAALLMGATASSFEQAVAIGAPVGIILGMLGGSTWPLTIVGTPMRIAAHITPHAWAVDGFVTLNGRHGGVTTIAGPLAVLGAFALVLLVFAARRVHRVLYV